MRAGPLVWALGPNSQSGDSFWGDSDEKFAVDAMDRIVDPIVLSQIGAGKNLSAGTDAATHAAFDKLWRHVNKTRDEAQAACSCPPNQFSCSCAPGAGNFTEWWLQLKREMPAAVRLQSLRAGDCADVNACLGTNGDGHCVCNDFKTL